MAVKEACRVVIVDDETLIRQGIKHYFNWEKEGFKIVGEASNGQEALDVIASVDPHILITDIVMPIMDGEELTKIVKEKHPDIEIIILSSFGEFDYVRSTFQSGAADYILKPKLEAEGLLKTLQTAARNISSLNYTEDQVNVQLSIDQIIDKMISGYDVDDYTDTIVQAFPNSHYQLLGVDLKEHQPKRQVELSTYMKEKIEFLAKDRLGEVLFHSYKPDETTLLIIMNVREKDAAQLVDIIHDLADLESHFSFVLSEMFHSFSQVGEVYNRSLLNLIQCRFYLPDKKVIFYDELTSSSKEMVHFNLEWFTEEFKRSQFESAFRYLNSHIKELTKCYTLDVHEYKSFVNNVIFTITVLLRNMGYNVQELEKNKYSIIHAIDEAPLAREVMEHLNQFIKEAKKCIDKNQPHSGNPNMNKILEYISNHYMEPLSLSEVAKHFHFNPSYFSSYFTAHNHESFIEYLNNIRIKEAAKLLRTSSSPISEISGIVGYSDHSYFCKVFKKITGLSPSKYRRKTI
ncbi:response regulator transcription factor [Evansella halocellulosilytica]|uniref:response regulator transcription factor n=1 Tax=Evansella halocellulosilytica TaxID=2011013 RepID=UPI000BB92DFB|nr:response regulator transcription factor [Evansella halocellulosilytica]